MSKSTISMKRNVIILLRSKKRSQTWVKKEVIQVKIQNCESSFNPQNLNSPFHIFFEEKFLSQTGVNANWRERKKCEKHRITSPVITGKITCKSVPGGSQVKSTKSHI